MQPLVTIVVLCYRNFNYVYQTLDSVFKQDYSNIELIVSDDGSAHFPARDIENYIERHKGTNITTWRINQNRCNVGTVKHLNIVARLAQGEYFMSVSADDTIDHAEVISTYVENLSNQPDMDILMAQTAMYDEQMKRVQYYFVQPHIKYILLHQQQTDALFNELIQYPYLPSVSTFFRRTFFDKYGYFDEQYSLVEDWSLHLRIARKHIPICYVDFVSIRHRSGGVSHGNTSGTSVTYQKYLNDLQRTYLLEIQPYLKSVPLEIRDRVEHQHMMDTAWIDWNIRPQKQGIIDILRYLIRHMKAVLLKSYDCIAAKIHHRPWGLVLSGAILNIANTSLLRALQYSCFLLFGTTLESNAFAAKVMTIISTMMIIVGVGKLALHGVCTIIEAVKGDMQLYF